jgi:hypothetical protein
MPRSYHCVVVLLQGCYDVTRMSTMFFQIRNRGCRYGGVATELSLSVCYKCVTRVLQWCYEIVTRVISHMPVRTSQPIPS